MFAFNKYRVASCLVVCCWVIYLFFFYNNRTFIFASQKKENTENIENIKNIENFKNTEFTIHTENTEFTKHTENVEKPKITINTETPEESYFLLSKVEEEISNGELLYYRLLEWVKNKNVTVVEPFVCDSYLGGLPGWTFNASSLYLRDPKCPLKPYSWYRDLKSLKDKALPVPISYNEFVERSHYCEYTTKPETPLSISSSVGYGKCAEICLVVHSDWSRLPNNMGPCYQNLLEQQNVYNIKNGRYLAIDPFTYVETTFSIVKYLCWHPDNIDSEGGLQNLLNIALNMKKSGQCATASVALHHMGKGTLKDIYKDQDWGGLSYKYKSIKYSDAMLDIASSIKQTKLGNGSYVAVQLRALRPSWGAVGLDEVSYRNCFQSIVDRVKKIMSDHQIPIAFLATEVLVRGSTGGLEPALDALIRRLFNEVILTAIPWVTTANDPQLAQLWQDDRGAHAMIDQILAVDAPFFVSYGGGSYNGRINELRNSLNRPMEQISCSPVTKPEVIPQPSSAPPLW